MKEKYSQSDVVENEYNNVKSSGNCMDFNVNEVDLQQDEIENNVVYDDLKY